MYLDNIEWERRKNLKNVGFDIGSPYAPRVYRVFTRKGKLYPRFVISFVKGLCGGYLLGSDLKWSSRSWWRRQGIPRALLSHGAQVYREGMARVREQEILDELKAAGMDLASMKDRRLYRIRSRNLRIGVFNAEDNGFYGIRTKFNNRFVFPEYHWENKSFPTVQPTEDLGIDLPEDILLAESFPGSLCPVTHGPVEFRRDHNDTSGQGKWFYVGTDNPAPKGAYIKLNRKLFAWLEKQEALHCVEGAELEQPHA